MLRTLFLNIGSIEQDLKQSKLNPKLIGHSNIYSQSEKQWEKKKDVN